METYRKPDGTEICDPEEYVAAWRDLARPIVEATTTDLYAFDPGLSLRSRGYDQRDDFV